LKLKVKKTSLNNKLSDCILAVMNERLCYLSFSVFSGVGSVTFTKLLTHFGSAKAAWESSLKDFEQVAGPALTKKFSEFRAKFNAQLYIEELEKKDVSFVCLFEDEYPILLKDIKKPPFVLYIKGNKKTLNQVQNHMSIAVVGTRKITQYGSAVTEMITADLVASGAITVSGLALGVDAVAHKTTIENGGKTIAVLGCGVDCCTPPQNQKLYDSIISSGGAIVSELPLGHGPTHGTFPARNRIITGLSQGIVVTEGAEDSGALITADYAFTNNRKVFAVPGPITSQLSKGPYKLISQGAQLVTSAKDILSELSIGSESRIQSSELRIKRGDTQEETLILELLQNEPLHFDDIIKKTGLSSTQLGSLLSIMEIKGIIKSAAKGLFIIS
jgi:DNA processing protein